MTNSIKQQGYIKVGTTPVASFFMSFKATLIFWLVWCIADIVIAQFSFAPLTLSLSASDLVLLIAILFLLGDAFFSYGFILADRQYHKRGRYPAQNDEQVNKVDVTSIK